MSFQERIKEARLAKKLTLQELGDKVGVRPQSVRQWEIDGMPRAAKIALIAEALDVSPEWLQFGTTVHQYIGDSQFNTNNNGVIGTQNNVSGNQHNFFQNDTPVEEARAILNDADAKFLVAMPLLSVDKGVEYATCPEKKEELLRSSSERVSIYMPHSDSTFAVKVPDNSLQGVVEPPIYANDILVIEPKIRPANNDLVLICLNHQQPNQRGIIAKIYVDLDDRCTIKYSSTQPETPLPESAVICGVHIKTTRYPFSNDIIASRIEPEWNIFNKIFNTNK